LLPRGQLTEATWQAVLAPPMRRARALASDQELAAEVVGPLVRLLLEPCLTAATAAQLRDKEGISDEGRRESLRIVVLPGFSMLCWAAAMKLTRAALVWPAPAASLM
ncbi:unnamed protein product, partial [Polarella glacialis]